MGVNKILARPLVAPLCILKDRVVDQMGAKYDCTQRSARKRQLCYKVPMQIIIESERHSSLHHGEA